MAQKKRTPEQNKAIYQRRVQRAKEAGFSGYGQKRYQYEKRSRLERLEKELQQRLRETFGEDILVWDELPPNRERAYNRIKASGLFTQAELDELRQAGDNFWQLARPMLERTSP